MKWHIRTHNEYDALKHVVVCPPVHMKIAEVINEVQKIHSESNINREKAMEQHREFTRRLQDYQVLSSVLPAFEELPEQVFTRDIGFTIGDKVFLSNLACDIRKKERDVVKEWLSVQGIPFHEIEKGTIEGGDVIVHGYDVFVGLTKRTNREAVECLRNQLPDYSFHTMSLREDILHLDCVFMPFSENEALWFPEAFTGADQTFLNSRFECLALTADEQFQMGCNILLVQEKTVFSMPQQVRINRLLRERGYRVIPIAFDEITKSGGSFRCCSFPIARKTKPKKMHD